MNLTHYIIVRRDLPFGVILASVAHAAGESFYAIAPKMNVSLNSMATMASGGFHAPVAQEERQVFNLEVGGANPSWGSTFDPAETTAVVLGARNQARLVKASNALHAAGVPFIEIRETAGEHDGQFMAIGVVPGDKATIAPLLREFRIFSGIEN